MHYLAKHFAEKITEQVEVNKLSAEFGPTLKYDGIYFGRMPDGEIVTVEEFVDGLFVKHINNDGEICGSKEDELVQKAECLAHYSHAKSNEQVMVVDIQGVKLNMFDPEIASTVLVSEAEAMFSIGNLSTVALK